MRVLGGSGLGANARGRVLAGAALAGLVAAAGCKRAAPVVAAATTRPASSLVAPPGDRPKPQAAKPDEPSKLSDKELCAAADDASTATANADASSLVRSMRAALGRVSAVRVRGVAMMEIPSIQSWAFSVQASRRAGLTYVAESRDKERVQIVQLPGGKTYASGRYLFTSQPELTKKIGDRWFEVPAALLTVKPGEADPDGPKGVFGLHIGHKAAIANFVQEALSWYPDQQAKWLFESKTGSAPTKQAAAIDKQHPYFADCPSVLLESRSQLLHLSASWSPLPLQLDPRPGTITGRFRWGEYNQPVPQQVAPPGAVALATALGR